MGGSNGVEFIAMKYFKCVSAYLSYVTSPPLFVSLIHTLLLRTGFTFLYLYSFYMPTIYWNAYSPADRERKEVNPD